MNAEERPDDLVTSYLALVWSYRQGFVRFASARIAALSLQNVVIAYRSQAGANPSESPRADVLTRIDKISLREYQAFEYIYDLSSLVYLTTLLDTFLSDTTKFLLLLHPRAIGPKQAVTLEDVLQAASTTDLLNDAAIKKTREVSYLPFVGRLEFLQQTFGLRLDLDDATMKQLEHYSSLRNTVVHDQGVFDCSLNAAGRIVVEQKTCSIHPVPISGNDVRTSEELYQSVVVTVCRGVVVQVLKGSEHPAYKKFVLLTKQRDGGAENGPA